MKKSPGAMVCHCCGKHRQTMVQRFRGAEVAMVGIVGRPRLTGVFRDIPSERRIRDYGAHGVFQVSHCALNKMVSVLRENVSTSPPSTAKLVQDSVNGVRKVARTARPGRWGCEKANKKRQIRIELGAAVHFVRVRLWLPLLQKVGSIVEGHQVGAALGGCMRWLVGGLHCHGQR